MDTSNPVILLTSTPKNIHTARSMRFLHKMLCKLLKMSSELAQTAEHKATLKKLRSLRKARQQDQAEHRLELERMDRKIDSLLSNIEALEATIRNRDETIDSLDHQVNLLEYDLKGMASVNARALKWIESLRMAEDKPTDGQNLTENLSEIEGSIQWPTS